MKFDKYFLFIFLVILLEVITLISFGQPIISETGRILLFWPEGSGIENSQQLSDWYSFSHFCHGILFFFLLSWIVRKFNLEKFKEFEAKLFIATLVEVMWEILENSPIIINRYRLTGLAAGYSGDSVVNSVSDIFFMLFGFWFARKFGWKISVCVFIFLELLSLYFIRDNLTLNVIMLIHPFTSINNWQVGS